MRGVKGNPLIWLPDQIIKRRGSRRAISRLAVLLQAPSAAARPVAVDGEIISLLKRGARAVERPFV